MEFSVPVSNQIAAPLKDRPPLRAEGNLRYLDFIRLVQYLWEQGHPEVPIKAVQSKSFTQYPVITYALNQRKTAQNEPKPRYRDNPIDESGQMYLITGQKFENVIQFTVITSNDPELAEHIIEIFEDFMLEYTPVFKRLGVSEFMYVRRLPDAEQTKATTDTETRAVAYMMIEERLRQISVDRFKEIIINARLYMKETGPEFVVNDSEDFITLANHGFIKGDGVIIMDVLDNSSILPTPLHAGWLYIIADVDGATFTLTDLHGNLINLSSSGRGRIVRNRYYKTDVNIEDLYNGATPNLE